MSHTDRPDPASVLARPDLAEQALEGVVRAAAYRDTRAMQATAPSTPVRAESRETATRLDALLFGEVFDVLDVADGFAWGRARRTGVVGHVAVESLSDEVLQPTHTVIATDAALPLNALVTVTSEDGAKAVVARGGPLPIGVLAEIGTFAADPVAVAESLLDAPYAAGGREPSGIDAAGLVQQALIANGRDGRRGLAARFAPSEAVERPRRGDVAVWSGHAGLAVDDTRLIHASACLGAVVIETVAAVAERQGGAPVWVRPD